MLQVPFPRAVSYGAVTMTMSSGGMPSDLYNPWTRTSNSSCSSSQHSMEFTGTSYGPYVKTNSQPLHHVAPAPVPIIKKSSCLRLSGSRSNGSLGYETDDSTGSSSWMASGRSRRVSFEDEEYGSKALRTAAPAHKLSRPRSVPQQPKTGFTRSVSHDGGFSSARPMGMRIKRQATVPGDKDSTFYARVCHQVG